MIGQLQDSYEFYPAAQWVPMTDLIRDSNWNLNLDDYPLTRELLEPVIHPNGQAYILTNIPLDGDPALQFLTENYVLDTEFGDRFNHLWTLPKLISIPPPRFLYRYAQNEASEVP